MIIDIIVVILLVLAIFKGLKKGFVVAVFSFIAFVIGLAAAVKLSAVVARYLNETTNISQKWLPLLAFALVFFVVALLVRLGAKAIEAALNLVTLGWLNKLGGVLFYGLLYFFIFSILLFYAEKLGIIKPDALAASLTASYIRPFGPRSMEILGWIIPAFKNMFTELETFFETISRSAA